MKKYSEEELKKAELEIQALIDSGKYKQLGFEVIESVRNIEISEKTNNIFKNVLDTYFRYLEMIEELSTQTKEKFIRGS